MLKRSWAAIALALLFFSVLPIQVVAADFQKQADGVVLPINDGSLKIQVMDENIIRVAFAKDPSFFTR